MLVFGLHSTSDDRPGWSMDLNPIFHPSPAKEIKCSFLDYVQLLMIGRAVQWTRTLSTTPLQSKNEMLIFGLCSTSDDQPGWSMDSSPICHPSTAKRIKCSFFDYVQLLMIGRAGRWTRTPFATPLQPIKWNAHFSIMFNFWWSAGLVDGLEPHLPPLSSQKNKMLPFGLHSTSDDRPGWSMDSNPIHHPSLAKKWNAHFWITFNFWWSAGPLFWLERGGRWGSSPFQPGLIRSWTNPKMIHFITFLAREGWQMGFESIDQPGRSSEVELNPKMSISLFWLERGGRWGSSPLTSPANHQKLNVIQKWAFQFFGWRGVVDRIRVHWLAQPIIRSWMQSKNEHFTFLAGDQGMADGSPSAEVEQKHFTFLAREGWGSSPSTSPADGWRGVADGVQSWPARPIIRSWMNIIQMGFDKTYFIFLAGERFFHRLANHQKLREVERNPKMVNFLAWGVGRIPLSQPECNPKMIISEGWRWVADGASPTSPAH